MRREIFVVLSIVFAMTACSKGKSDETSAQQVSVTSVTPHLAKKDSSGSLFIPVDTANIMISSYVKSLNSQQNVNGENLKSFSIDADSLRALLANENIRNVKLIFAHTQDYINSGNFGVFSGLQSGAMTIIVAGYDANGNYIYLGHSVLDHAVPCPYNCPPGIAGGDLLN